MKFMAKQEVETNIIKKMLKVDATQLKKPRKV